MKIVLCGAGNATHVISALAGQQGHDVRILSLYADEAERLRTALQAANGELRCPNDLTSDYVAALDPEKIQKDPQLVVPGAELVLMAVPSFAHQMYAEAIAPFISPGTIIGGMPAQGGFDMCMSEAFGQELADTCSFFGMETLPWACRIQEFGRIVEVLGTKKEVDICTRVDRPEIASSVIGILQDIVGEYPKLIPASNFLGVTLMNINSVWHPTITYGQYRNWDLTTPFAAPPLFYEGADDFTAGKLSAISNEVLQIVAKLQTLYPDLDLAVVHHVKDWMQRAYGEDIADTTSLRTMLNTNKGYIGLVHPMIANPNGEGFLPNFQYRYMSEDVPFGLVVTKGIAQLADVATPNMDEVIKWSQVRLQKQFLVNGELKGKDVASTRAPQRYGFQDLETFMQANRYIPENNKSKLATTGCPANDEVRGIELAN